MADLLESESIQALLSMKNGTARHINLPAATSGSMSPVNRVKLESCTTAGSPTLTRVKREPLSSTGEWCSSSVSLLSALGLNPTGQNTEKARTRTTRSANSTPVKDTGSLSHSLNRRGTPQRVRKRNRLYFDDNHVSEDICRSSKKSLYARERLSPHMSSSSGAHTAESAPSSSCQRSATNNVGDDCGVGDVKPPLGIRTTPVRQRRTDAVNNNANNGDSHSQSATVKVECQQRLDNSVSASNSRLTAAGPRQSIPADSSASGAELSVERKREAHQLGLRLRNLLKLPKAHKFVCYEWFYSTLDECLLRGSNDFLVCLREQYPRLKGTCLARKEWSKLRRQMGKPRRCSPAFFLEERCVLSSLRQKVRSLQTLQRKTYERAFLKNLPDEIPLQLSIGTRVTARLTSPQDGLFNGTVEAVDTMNASYRVSFERCGLGSRTVSDCDVRSVEPAETVPTVSFVRGSQSQRSLVFSTPPRPQLAASGGGIMVSALNLGSPLSNDPLLSALTPSKSELSQLDEDGVINGYSIKFLLSIVQLNKLLIMKREHVSQLDGLNSHAEQCQMFAEPLADQFRRQYAKLVLQLDALNQQLQERTTSVQNFCHKMLPDVGLVPDVLPTHMKRLCDEEAGRQVAAAAAARRQLSQRQPRHRSTMQLISRLASLLLQMKNFADNEMNPFELSSMEETMREISEALVRPDTNTRVFQDHVHVNVAHVQHVLTTRWNWRRAATHSSNSAASSNFVQRRL